MIFTEDKVEAAIEICNANNGTSPDLLDLKFLSKNYYPEIKKLNLVVVVSFDCFNQLQHALQKRFVRQVFAYLNMGIIPVNFDPSI